MPLTNNLKPIVDLPVWEWCRFAPATTISTSTLITQPDGKSKYLYYLVGNTLYKYNTVTDGWQLLSTHGITVSTILGSQYMQNYGWSGNVLSGSSSTLQLPSINQNLNNYQIKITSGKGAGQIRTITSTGNEVIHDSAVASSINSSVFTDSTKKWKHNQWEGYGCYVSWNANASQPNPNYREILYNDPTSVTLFDVNYISRNPLSSVVQNTLNPYGTLTQWATFNIVSQTITVDTPWDITPDTTSKFMVLSGQIAFFSNSTFFIYDILSDRWVQKPLPFFPSSPSYTAEVSLTHTSNIVGYYMTGSVTSFTSQSISDSTLSLTKGEWVNSAIQIISGSGAGQERRIINNTNNTFLLSRKWEIMPDANSIYAVTAENGIWMRGGNRSFLYKYYPEASLWNIGNITDYGFPAPMALIKQHNLDQSHSVNTATRVTTGITAVNSIPTAAGLGYSIGDLLTISTGGTLGRVYVEKVSDVGAVLEVSLYTCGGGYSVGTGRATTGGTGTGCTIEITSVDTIGVVTTAINHDFLLGDSVKFEGATEAAWNTTYTILGIQSATVVEFIITANANATARHTTSSSLIVDVTKNWEPNEHVGKVLYHMAGGSINTNVISRKIIGNTNNTISVGIGYVSNPSIGRYYIQDDVFGESETYPNQPGFGYPTSTTTSSITDSTKNWLPAAWNNHRILLTHDNGITTENIIVTNTSSSLNIGRTVAVGSGTNTIAYNERLGSGSYSGSGASIFTTSGNAICWNGTRFVAVGSGTNTIAWSNDSITWNGLGTTIFSTSGNGVAYNGNKFIGVGAGGNTIAWSNDSITWTGLGTGIFSTQGNSIAWDGSRWVAMGQGTNTIAYSNDTGSISFIGLGTLTFSTAGRGVCWAGTQWVGVGNGTNTYATSSNGINWAGGGTSIFSTQGNAVAWNGQVTVAVGSGTNTIAYSTDSGSTWTGLGTSIFSTAGLSIAWNGTHWIAGGQGTNTTAYSADGINWTGNGSTIITTTVNGICSTSPYLSMTPNIGIAPNTNTRYKILNTSGEATAASTTTLTDPTKKWKVNQWTGKRMVLTSLLSTGGVGAGTEYTITSNTSNTLSFGSLGGSIIAGQNYSILNQTVNTAGSSLHWNFNLSLPSVKGKKLISSRGSGFYFDIYDIPTGKFNMNLFSNGIGESMSQGTMYWYDDDRIYYIIQATNRVFYYDLVKNTIESAGTIPYGMGGQVLGNRMCIVKTEDGLKYLYIMRHSGTEMWRTLVHF